MKINKFKNSLIFKVICFLLIFSMLPWNVFQPTTVKADGVSGHDSYFLQSLYNPDNGYMLDAVDDKNGWGESIEEKTIKKVCEAENGDNRYIDWSIYSVHNLGDDAYNPFSYGKEIKTSEDKINLTDDTGLVFSFPSIKRASSDNYQVDRDRGAIIGETLTGSLNDLVKQVKDNISYNQLSKDSSIENKISDTIKISRMLNPSIDGATSDAGSYFTKVKIGDVLEVYYANYNKELYTKFMDGKKSQQAKMIVDGKEFMVDVIDEEGNLLMYYFKPGKVTKQTELPTGVVWAMPKGYLNPLDGTPVSTATDTNHWGVENSKSSENKGDAIWLTIFSIAEYANAQRQYRGYNVADAVTDGTDWLFDFIYSFLWGAIKGLTYLLQLKPIPQLIFNEDIMSDSWWNVVLKYHLIFQIVSWMMLIVAVAKILIQINFSTVNPTVKMSIMDTGQKLFTVGFSLALCVPFIRMLADLNELIVNIFQTQGLDEGNMLSGFGIAGLVIMLGYIGITFTMNCIYIMRAIMIAILTSSAPLFITSMAFSGPKQKGLMDNWLKEISANIFMQSIHAFAFAFLFDVMDSSKLIVRLVIYFSLLPIVDSFRQLVFGQSGGFAVSQGQKAAQTVGNFVGQTAGGVAKGALNGALSKYGMSRGWNMKTAETPGGGGSDEDGSSGSKTDANFKHNLGEFSRQLKESGHTRLGSAVSGASKALDLYKSSGGIMNNAATQANLGNVDASVKASKSYGEGVAVNTERSVLDGSQAVQNRVGAWAGTDASRQQTIMNDELNNINNANEVLNNPNSTASEIREANSTIDSSRRNYARAQRRYNRDTRLASAANSRETIASNDSSGNTNVELNTSDMSKNALGETLVSTAAVNDLNLSDNEKDSLGLTPENFDATTNAYNVGKCGVVINQNGTRAKLLGINRSIQNNSIQTAKRSQKEANDRRDEQIHRQQVIDGLKNIDSNNNKHNSASKEIVDGSGKVIYTIKEK